MREWSGFRSCTVHSLAQRFSRHGFRSSGGEERSRGPPSAVESDPAGRLESAACASSAGWKEIPPFANTQVFVCLFVCLAQHSAVEESGWCCRRDRIH